MYLVSSNHKKGEGVRKTPKTYLRNTWMIPRKADRIETRRYQEEGVAVFVAGSKLPNTYAEKAFSTINFRGGSGQKNSKNMLT